MKLVKRVIGCFLALSILASLTACSKDSSKVTTSSESQKPVTLSILIGGDNTPPATNNVLKEIAKETNITLTPIYVPLTDYSTKLNTLTASKSLPDIFAISDVTNALQFKTNGAIADLTKLVPKYMTHYYPDAKSMLSKNPLNTSGKVYAVFDLSLTYAANLNIRTDWLKNVGLSMPTDLDSLYNVLDAFTNKDPDKNGKKDTFGLDATMNVAAWENFSTIFGAYGVPAGKPIVKKDGTVTTFMNAPNYLAAIKYFKKLYSNGLMDPDFATVPAMTSYGKLWNGKCGAMDFRCVGPTNNWMPSRYTEKVAPTFDFATIKGPDGKAGLAMQYPNYSTSIVVSSTCKNPAAAVRLLDFCYSDKGDELLRLGVEGLHFKWIDKANGKYETLKPYDDSAASRNDGVFVYWSHILTPKNNAEVRTFNKQTQEGVALANKNSTIPWAYIYTAFDANKTYGTTLQQIEKEVFCTLVTTKGDVDAEYAKGITRWNNEGGKDWEKQATTAYKSQK